MLKVDLHIKRANLLLLGVVLNGMVLAQSTGIVAGSIKNANTGEPLSGVAVKIISLNKKTASEPSGNYTLAGLSQGQYTLEFSSKGWQTQTVDSVMITGGKLTKVNVDLINNNKNNTTARTAAQIDTAKTLVALQKTSAPIADGVSALGIKGRVIDVETLEPIPGVSIVLLENGKATSTNERGEFTIPVNTKGKYSIETSYLGYNKETTPVVFTDKNWEMVNVVLVNASSALDEVVVSRRRSQVGELALLEERKVSTLMLEKIGAQELSRKGVSDAEGALTKMSGVTKSASGANVFVRGLGDRYNNTTLNGLALPSEDPQNKNISLDFFGTGVIQSIGVNKTFNATLQADVAGANIDIISKELSEDQLLEIGVSAGVNSQSINGDNFRRVDGTNWFGSLKDKKSPISNLNSYDFSNNWNPKVMETPINSSFSIMGGKNLKVGDGSLNVLLIGNMNSDYKYAEGLIRQTTNDGTISLDQATTRSQYNVSKSAMANLKYTFGKHYVSYNSMYINDQSQDFESNIGFKLFDVKDNGFFIRSQVQDNHLFVNQLLSKLDLTDNWKLDLGIGNNSVRGNEPDRRTIEMLDQDQTGSYRLYDTQNYNERYFSELTENGWTAKAIATHKFLNTDDLDRKVEFGYNGNLVKRDFNAIIFGHLKTGSLHLFGVDVNDMDAIYGKDKFMDGGFTFESGRGADLTPYWYKGERNIHSAIVSGTYQFNQALTAVLGVRYDNVFQNMTYNTNMSNSEVDGPSRIEKDYVLPSLNLKYALNEKSNLRASASMSYTLPQFIETAYFKNTFSTGSVIGNKDLVPVENLNFDLKWELFPEQGELISVGVFYKQLKNPIARVESSNNVMTYFNVGSSAQVAGAEVEFKKNLLTTTNEYGENILSVGANVSYLYSTQKLQNEKAIFTAFNGTSKLQGASPLLANADVSYLLNANKLKWTSTLVFNYFSDRVFAIGTNGFRNVIEKSVPTLDFITSATLKNNWGINLKARNILNPAIELERESDQGNNITLQSIKRGVDLSIGLTYKF